MSANTENSTYQANPLCGLFGCNVATSVHNNNGTCQCLTCMGMSCRWCKTYVYLLKERLNRINMRNPSRCDLCKAVPLTNTRQR